MVLQHCRSNDNKRCFIYDKSSNGSAALMMRGKGDEGYEESEEREWMDGECRKFAINARGKGKMKGKDKGECKRECTRKLRHSKVGHGKGTRGKVM